MPFENIPSEIDYKALLDFKRVDTNDALSGIWCFAVSENYTIFLTGSTHKHLFDSCGVDPEKTLTEGYVKFDLEHKVQDVDFKNSRYQSTPGFKGSPEDLKKLQNAIEEIIREKLAGK